MRDDVRQVASTCMGLVLRDTLWHHFGFRRRPMGGRIPRRIFLPAWRVDLEHAVSREMLIMLTAVHVTAGVIERDRVEDVLRIYVRGPNGNSDLWKTFGYTSPEAAENHIRDSVSAYLDCGIQEWLGILPERLGTIPLCQRA